MQIATERSVFVFDLLVKDTRLRRRMMAVVADVLSNKDIVKLGVAVKGDIVGLAKSSPAYIPVVRRHGLILPLQMLQTVRHRGGQCR